jgi:hypothetical protein
VAVNPFVFHIDQFLTNLSVMYRNGQFVSGLIMPGVPVLKQSDLFATYGTDNLRSLDDAISPKSVSNEVIMSRSGTQYYCDGHALKHVIADEDRANDDLGSLDIDATILLTDQILLNREINCLNNVIAGVGATNDLSASSGADQFDNDSFDPIKYIDEQKITIAKKIGRKPNVLVLSTPVLKGLRNNALVKGRITGAPSLDGSAITLQQLAAVLEIEQVIEASAVVNTAAEGMADALDFVWKKYALLSYVPKTPGLRTLSLGYHFMWNFPAASPVAGKSGLIDDIIPGGAGYGMRQWYDKARRSTIIEATMYYSQQVVCPNAGILFSNAVSEE